MTHIEYEIMVSEIAELFANNPLEDKPWKFSKGRKNRIIGFSGYKHQIDVSLECDTDLVLLECKKWKKRKWQIKIMKFL